MSSVYTVLYLHKDVLKSNIIGVYSSKDLAIDVILKRLELIHDYFSNKIPKDQNLYITKDEVSDSLRKNNEICWTEHYQLSKYKINEEDIDKPGDSDEEECESSWDGDERSMCAPLCIVNSISDNQSKSSIKSPSSTNNKCCYFNL
jgi:hypothetical protein